MGEERRKSRLIEEIEEGGGQAKAQSKDPLKGILKGPSSASPSAPVSASGEKGGVEDGGLDEMLSVPEFMWNRVDGARRITFKVPKLVRHFVHNIYIYTWPPFFAQFICAHSFFYMCDAFRRLAPTYPAPHSTSNRVDSFCASPNCTHSISISTPPTPPSARCWGHFLRVYKTRHFRLSVRRIWTSMRRGRNGGLVREYWFCMLDLAFLEEAGDVA